MIACVIRMRFCNEKRLQCPIRNKPAGVLIQETQFFNKIERIGFYNCIKECSAHKSYFSNSIITINIFYFPVKKGLHMKIYILQKTTVIVKNRLHFRRKPARSLLRLQNRSDRIERRQYAHRNFFHFIVGRNFIGHHNTRKSRSICAPHTVRRIFDRTANIGRKT